METGFSREQQEMFERINQLKKEKNAVCLVHNYQRPEIYEVADFIGDSLGLSRQAAKTDADLIVFCGVDFMAETAKILSPEKRVLIPASTAKCPMAAMATAPALRAKKKEFPGAAVASYVNTSAEVKSESDICCTSANSVQVVNSLEQEQVIFVPDMNLASWVERQTDKKIIKWGGYCYVHHNVSAVQVREAKEKHPAAKVVAHPECPLEVLEVADHVCGTGGMIKYARENPAREFIIVTEEGMVNRLKREVPGKTFYVAAGVCVNMKKITLPLVLECLEKERYEVSVDENVCVKAKKALDRMLAVK